MTIHLNGFDLLRRPGEPAVLRLRVHRAHILATGGGIPGVRLRLRGPGLDATAITDARGFAEIPLPQPPPGLVAYVARAPDHPALNSTAVVLLTLPHDHPTFVTDIDRTISDASSWIGTLRAVQRVRPVAGSVAVLRGLAQRYAIVYLTARNVRFMWKTRRWLRHHGFPLGPLFLRPVVFWRARSGRYKRTWLRQLTQRFARVEWGVGDRRSDVAAYRAAGITPIRMTGRRTRWHNGVWEARSWHDIRAIVDGETPTE